MIANKGEASGASAGGEEGESWAETTLRAGEHIAMNIAL